MSMSRHSIWSNQGMSNDVRHVLNRVFLQAEGNQSTEQTTQWAPMVDIREEETRFVILADIRGVDPAGIEVSMDKSMLTIKGERTAGGAQDNGKLTRQERVHGVFQRRFALPESADANSIRAHGRHGVLEIVVPKKAATMPRRITILTAE